MQTIMVKKYIALTAFLVGLISGAGVFMMGNRVINGIDSNSWDKTYGVLKSVTQERLSNEVYDELKVCYQYKAAGVMLSGSRISYRVYDEGISFSELKQKEGGEIEVYFSQKNPKKSVLMRGVGVGSVVVLSIVSLVFIGAVGSFIMLLAFPEFEWKVIKD